MAENIEKIAELMGAKIVGKVPATGGGAFGAARLGRVIDANMNLNQSATSAQSDSQNATGNAIEEIRVDGTAGDSQRWIVWAAVIAIAVILVAVFEFFVMQRWEYLISNLVMIGIVIVVVVLTDRLILLRSRAKELAVNVTFTTPAQKNKCGQLTLQCLGCKRELQLPAVTKTNARVFRFRCPGCGVNLVLKSRKSPNVGAA